MVITEFFQNYELIRSFVTTTKPYIIYGAGSNGKRVADYLQQYPATLEGFSDSDSNKHGKQFQDYPIFSPQQAIDSGYMIIVASTWYPQIIASLRTMGAENIINLSLIGLAKQPMIDNVDKRLKAVEQKLADQQSKIIFKTLLKYLLDDTGTPLPLSNYPQYLHPKVLQLQKINMIDGGACLGESLDSFKNYLNNHINMLCIEPELGNIKLLKEKITKMQLNDNIQVIEAGLWSEDTQLKFSSASASGLNVNCNINEQGDIVITTRAIDSICTEQNFVPNFIKMDIEGAEVAALIGAKKIITKHKPILAICLYHHLDDLWTIPEYIHTLRSDYKMSLGHHSDNWFETVLYCY